MKIEELIAFIEDRAEGFRGRIRPIAPGLLSELEGVAQRPLPNLYREYLMHMGGDPAELRRPRWDLSPRAILHHTQIDEGYPKPRFVLMGLHQAGPLEPVENWYFDRDAADQIVRFETVDPAIQHVTPTFLSFEELLVDWAARIFVFPKEGALELQLPHTVEADGRKPDDGNAQCRSILQKMGFHVQLASTADLWFGRRDDSWALVQNLPGPDTYSFFVLLTGPDSAHTAEILKDNLGDPDDED